MSKNGLHLITPTSIASTGTGNSSSISANGSVTFSTCATLSLNGVFSADYDNYMIVMRHNSAVNVIQIQARLRASGTDATGANYTFQRLEANSTTINASRSSSQTYTVVGQTDNDNASGDVHWVYGPFLAQPTAFRNVNVMGNNGATIYDQASTHSLSTSYDGLTFIGEAGFAFSGLVGVYGMRK